MPVTPAQISFNGGEVSERLHMRWDQNVRGIAVKKMLGWFPTLQGPAEACPGTLFVAAETGPFRPIPYEFNPTQGYIAALLAGVAHFYTNDVRIETAPGVPYAIATPWTMDETRALTYHQELDVMYLAVRTVPLQRLYRTSADTFGIADQVLRNGPFEPKNSTATTVSASATTGGSITITASAGIFESGDVGGLMEIEFVDLPGIKAWEAGMTVALNDVREVNGNVYQAGASGRTGQVAPNHVEGTRYDGMGGTDVNDKGPYGVPWTYLYNRWGLVQFTGYTSATQMTATVLTRLAAAASPTDAWRFGAFSDRRGYPEVAGVWQERLVLCKDRSYHCSVAGELDNFALRNEYGDPTADMAFSGDIPGAAPIRWVCADKALIVGTSKGEYLVAQSNQANGAGPGNVDTGRAPKGHGSAPGQALHINNRVVFIQAAKTRVIQLAYDSSQLLREESDNMCRFADHLATGEMNDAGALVGAAFEELAWCPLPETLLWARRADGTLAACAYDPDEQLLGWCQRHVGGVDGAGLTVTGIASITDPDGRFAQLWMGVQSGDSHWMLRMAPIRATGDKREQVMTDAALRYQGAATTAASAPHLAGRTVEICADGRPIMATLDNAGAYTLDKAASDIIVGLRFPNEIVLLAQTGGADNGAAWGKAKISSRVDLAVINSDTLEVELPGGAKEKVNLLKVATAIETANPLASGRQKLEPRGDYDDLLEIKIRRLYARPSTVTTVMPYFESAQA